MVFILHPFLQIVRTDLKELRDFDLEGAPYGYTPFCESRREMDGYRFWKSGYWASHLAGRKYHIRYEHTHTLRTVVRVKLLTCLQHFEHQLPSNTLTYTERLLLSFSIHFSCLHAFFMRGRLAPRSALYVVDLKKFRKIAAGDRLRGQYQGLSQDPNSLSNLDQVCDSVFAIRSHMNIKMSATERTKMIVVLYKCEIAHLTTLLWCLMKINVCFMWEKV